MLTILATITEVPKPRPDKSAKKVLRKVLAQRGAEESADKALRPSSLCRSNNEAQTPKRFFGTFLGTPFGAGSFRSTFLALLLGRGFGTSVAGRQDCKPMPSLQPHTIYNNIMSKSIREGPISPDVGVGS